MSHVGTLGDGLSSRPLTGQHNPCSSDAGAARAERGLETLTESIVHEAARLVKAR